MKKGKIKAKTGHDNKDLFMQSFSYVWITLVAYYIFNRLVATITTYNLPSIKVNVCYNIFIAACWFGILCMPSIILLIHISTDKEKIIKILELVLAVFMILVTLFLLFHFS